MWKVAFVAGHLHVLLIHFHLSQQILRLLSDVYQEFSYELLLNIGTYYVYITAFAMSNLQTVVANRVTQDTFLSHKRIWIHNFHIPFFFTFFCFSKWIRICNLCLLSLFLLSWDLKKVPCIALLSTANFEQVIIISHFANF